MNYFNPEDKLKYALEQRWKKKLANQFPQTKRDLIEKYNYIEKFLNENKHPDVTLGAAIAGDGLLTDHGVDHIQMVMQKAYDILGDKKVSQLKGYEIFLLLLAIHFHDIGNIHGREDHEQEIGKIIDELSNDFPFDNIERTHVARIATSHGGYYDKASEDKDTLRHLETEVPCNGLPIRPALLAAVLRFADELSDDKSRCIKIKIPTPNEVFHAYSDSLESPYIQGETISFRYRIPYENTQKQLGKGDKTVFLYDEIRDRLAKCMRELEYCRKYAGDYIGITTLNVTIYIMDKNSAQRHTHEQTFRLRLLGYPDPGCTKFDDFLESKPTYRVINKGTDINFSTGAELKNVMSGGTGA